MWCRLSMGQAEDSGEHPCDVCWKGVTLHYITLHYFTTPLTPKVTSGASTKS